MDTPLDSLDAIESRCWDELVRAATRGQRHPWRQMVLATTDGEAADARTIVLREVHRDARTLVLYTDARSPKVAQIQAHAGGTLVAWSDELAWQLRLRVQLSVDIGGLAALSRWARLKLTPSARDYLSPLAPGTVIGTPAPAAGDRDHFAVVTAAVTAIDWLELRAEGHRRAAFDGNGRRWLQP